MPAKIYTAGEQLRELYGLTGLPSWEDIIAAKRGWQETAQERYPQGFMGGIGGVPTTFTSEYGGIKIPTTQVSDIPTDLSKIKRRVSPTPEAYIPPTDTGMGIGAPPQEPDMWVKRDSKGNIVAAQDYPAQGFEPHTLPKPQRIGELSFYGKGITEPTTYQGKTVTPEETWKNVLQTSPETFKAAGRDVPVADYGIGGKGVLRGYVPPQPQQQMLPSNSTYEQKLNRVNQIKMQIMEAVRRMPDKAPYAQAELGYRLEKEGLTMEQLKIHDIGGIGYIQRGNQFIPVTTKETKVLSQADRDFYEKEYGMKLPPNATDDTVKMMMEGMKEAETINPITGQKEILKTTTRRGKQGGQQTATPTLKYNPTTGKFENA